MDVSAIPFNKHLGLTISDVDGERAVCLQPSPHHLNHVHTVHASVIFGLSEAASGHCLVTRFPDLGDSFVAVLRKSEVKYLKPAAADARLCAYATLEEESAVRFRGQLTSRRRATVDIVVSVVQDDVELFLGRFGWFAAVRQP